LPAVVSKRGVDDGNQKVGLFPGSSIIAFMNEYCVIKWGIGHFRMSSIAEKHPSSQLSERFVDSIPEALVTLGLIPHQKLLAVWNGQRGVTSRFSPLSHFDFRGTN
jgi:hypothetical protein